jgi:soluble lytic murein transglycosylase
MRFNLPRNLSKVPGMVLLSLAMLGLEPAFHSLVDSPPAGYENLKLVMDTRAQVVLKHKLKISCYLDQVAPTLASRDKRQLVQLIYQESQEQGIDPGLIVALIKTESGFRNTAYSTAGARGLMQLRLPTAQEIAQEMGLKWKGSKSLHEPQLNIRMGTYYLAKMFQRFEDLELALTAYNIGPTALGRLITSQADMPQKYSRRVLKNYQLLEQPRRETL